jgi:hypothetical protein
MTTLVHTESRGDYQLRTDKTLVSTAAFNNEFYTYTQSKNPATGVTSGVFTLVSGATAATCPTGRVLHLTGRKLYPDVHPMTTFVGALSAKKFLVSVYDPISFLTGFVDPSSATFANFDQNLPNFFDLGRNGSGVEWPGGGQGAEGSGGYVDSGTLTVTTDPATAQAGSATVGLLTQSFSGGNTVTIVTTACRATSRVFLTQVNSQTALTSSVEAVLNGSFRVRLQNAGSWQFLIITA